MRSRRTHTLEYESFPPTLPLTRTLQDSREAKCVFRCKRCPYIRPSSRLCARAKGATSVEHHNHHHNHEVAFYCCPCLMNHTYVVLIVRTIVSCREPSFDGNSSLAARYASTHHFSVFASNKTVLLFQMKNAHLCKRIAEVSCNGTLYALLID